MSAARALPRLPPAGRAPAARLCCCVVGLACAGSVLRVATLLRAPPPPTAVSNRTDAPRGVPDAVLRLERASRAWEEPRRGQNASADRALLRQIDPRWREPGGGASALTVDLARAVGWLARQLRAPR